MRSRVTMLPARRNWVRPAHVIGLIIAQPGFDPNGIDHSPRWSPCYTASLLRVTRKIYYSDFAKDEIKPPIRPPHTMKAPRTKTQPSSSCSPCRHATQVQAGECCCPWYQFGLPGVMAKPPYGINPAFSLDSNGE